MFPVTVDAVTPETLSEADAFCTTGGAAVIVKFKVLLVNPRYEPVSEITPGCKAVKVALLLLVLKVTVAPAVGLTVQLASDATACVVLLVKLTVACNKVVAKFCIVVRPDCT